MYDVYILREREHIFTRNLYGIVLATTLRQAPPLTALLFVKLEFVNIRLLNKKDCYQRSFKYFYLSMLVD